MSDVNRKILIQIFSDDLDPDLAKIWIQTFSVMFIKCLDPDNFRDACSQDSKELSCLGFIHARRDLLSVILKTLKIPTDSILLKMIQ